MYDLGLSPVFDYEEQKLKVVLKFMVLKPIVSSENIVLIPGSGSLIDYKEENMILDDPSLIKSVNVYRKNYTDITKDNQSIINYELYKGKNILKYSYKSVNGDANVSDTFNH